MTAPLWSTRELGLTPTSTGKVRDLFDLGDRLLLVATDRISAYDAVLADPIPGKGVLLTQMSLEWFKLLAPVTQNHLLTAQLEELPEPFCRHPALAGRSMLVQKARRIDCECIVRGYLSGSGWREYQRTGKVCGIALPAGLRESQQLAEPIFTPSTKASTGHDENIDYGTLERLIGSDVAARVAALSLAIYTRAAEYARQRGIIVADTKFEFGFAGDTIILIDEVLSPDSSRFWPAEQFEPGRAQVSFDKQYLRDWLDASGWDHTPPPPRLPADVVQHTQERYRSALERLFPQALSRLAAAVSSQ